MTSFSVESYKFLIPSATSPTPTSSTIRINVFWFTSLSLSLTTVLLGTTCMQWLREYRHYDPLTHKDALLLRHMRYEGLIRWKVPVILSLLPTLLQAALVFFFIGILDLLLGLNRAVAFIVAITIGLAMIFMVGTTIAPAIQYLLDRREDICERSDAQCPYKSPQSWACLQIMILATLVLEHIKRWATSWRIWLVEIRDLISPRKWLPPVIGSDSTSIGVVRAERFTSRRVST